MFSIYFYFKAQCISQQWIQEPEVYLICVYTFDTVIGQADVKYREAIFEGGMVSLLKGHNTAENFCTFKNYSIHNEFFSLKNYSIHNKSSQRGVTETVV